jgi:hypothetical protein
MPDHPELPGAAPHPPPNPECQPTRRQALAILGTSATAACAGLTGCAARSAAPGKKPAAGEDDLALDEVLRQLQAAEPRSLQGLSTHAPMAAEALCALGFPQQAGPWLKKYRRPVHELPRASRRIDPIKWKDALGPDAHAETWEQANGRWGDWKEFFTAELAERPWRDVLEVWVARLAPGMSGAATHGVIRTAHAVRALARRKTPQRLGELARGLAYWASSYEELPVHKRTKPRLDTFAAALDEVPLYRTAFGKSPQGRNIVEVLRQVKKVDGFGQVRDAVIVPADLSAALSALTATFTRVYLRHGTRNDTIAFVHAVTGPCTLRRLAAHVSAKTARAAFPYAWQTAAAVFSAYVRVRENGRFEESKRTAEELAARAVRNGDEHAIKFTEVMLAEHKLNPDPVYLAAAEDVIGRL